jgi:NAD(P)H-flavin reductase
MATLVHRIADGAGTRLFFEVDAAARAAHVAIGQYCPISAGDAQGYFALASRPGAERFEFYVAPGGQAADQLLAAPLGSTFAIAAPAGRGFGIEAALEGTDDLVVVATGSALGAVYGAIEAAADGERSVRVYYGCRTLNDAPYQASLAALNIDLHWVCSQNAAHGQRTGYVQAALAADAVDLKGAWLIACGQGAMQTEAKTTALALGLTEERFLTNY